MPIPGAARRRPSCALAGTLALRPARTRLPDDESFFRFGARGTGKSTLLPGAQRGGRLRAYALAYIKEEVQAEQFVRHLEPFRRFLDVAAQQNGRIVNHSAIGREVGIGDGNTVLSWFQILEDTLLGFWLPAFHRSIRRSQRASPRFYPFDPGVKRALDRTLDVPLRPGTSAFGDAFEHLVVAEFSRRNEVFERDYRLSYLHTKDGAEVDLILSKPGALRFVEVKSSDRVDPVRVGRFARLVASVPGAEGHWLSRDPVAQDVGGVRCRFWREGLRSIVGAAA